MNEEQNRTFVTLNKILMLLSDNVISITRFGQKSLIEVLHCTFKVSLITADSIKQIKMFYYSKKKS